MFSSETRADPARLLKAIDASVGLFHAEVGANSVRLGAGLRNLLGYAELASGDDGIAVTALAHPDDVSALGDVISAGAQGRERVARTRLCRADGGQITVRVQIVPVTASGSASEVVGIVTPWSDNFGEETEANPSDTASPSDREAIARVVGGIAHDFNNLFAVILGNVDIMTPEDDVETFEQSRNDIVAACLRGSELIRRMAAFAQASSLQPRSIGIRRLLDELGWGDRGARPDGLAMEIRLESGLWDVSTDPLFLRSSLEALLKNALEAMPGGGAVTIEAENLLGVEAGRDASLAPGRYVALSISDNGLGLPPAMIDRVFEPFFSTKRPGVGAGLGLSMVRGFARQSGGDATIENRPGGGATVRIILPAEEAASAVTAAPAQEFREQVHLSGWVLLVDDEPDVLRYVRLTLEGMGLDVRTASSGAEAVEIFEATPDRFDVLLTDIVMPGELHGRALAATLRRLRPDLKVGYLSGFSSVSRDDESEDAPDDVFLEKPIRAERLAAAVSALIGPRTTG